jgi:putative ABC transport system permease protein
MNALRLAWKNLRFKPLSTALSLILFGLGTGLITLLLLLNHQMQEKFDKNLAGIDLVVGAKGSPLQLILCNMYHIDVPTGNISIQEATPFLREGHPLIEIAILLSLGDSYKGYRIVGTTYQILDLYETDVAEGRRWEREFEVVIGAGVAADLNLKLNDAFHSSHGFVLDDNLVHDDGEKFKVVGILAPSGSVADQLILTSSQSVWAVHDHHDHDHDHEGHDHDHAHHDHDHDHDHAHHDHDHDHNHAHHDHDHDHDHDEQGNCILTSKSRYADNLLDNPEQQITSMLLKFKNRNFQTLNLARNINENTGMQAASPAIEMNRLYSMMGIGMDALQALALAIMLVSGLSIFFSLFSSLRERRYELALMRVMGASPGRVFILILLEGMLLAFLGYLLGLVLSHGCMELFSGFLKESYRYDFSGWVFIQEEWWVLLASLAIGLVAAAIPAWQAQRTDISTTLGQA